MKLKIVLMFFIVVQFSFAQETKNEIIKPNESTVEKDWEIWQEKVPISGNVRVGLMIDQSNEKHVNPEHFYAVIPEYEVKDDSPKTKNLCVELSSRDGRYSAKIDYTINLTFIDDDNPKHLGVEEFELPTKYIKELSKFTTNEVVILASLSDDCTRAPETYVLAGWFEINPSFTSFSVYLNSIMPARVQLGQSNIVQCQPLKPPTVAYSKKCTIRAVESLQDNSVININQRRKRGTSTKNVTYKMPLRYYKK